MSWRDSASSRRTEERRMATETAIDVVMPQMGVSVSEGTVTRWLKQEGEHVEADEPLLEISTDKVDTEVPSPGSGTVTQILVLRKGRRSRSGRCSRGSAALRAKRPRRRLSRLSRLPRSRLPRSPSLSPLRSPSRRPRRARTARHSSRPSWRASRPSTASTLQRCRAPGAAAASRNRTSWPSSSPARRHRPRLFPRHHPRPQRRRPQLPLRPSPHRLLQQQRQPSRSPARPSSR